MSKVKRVYSFGNKTAEGRADMKNLLGGKGANLAEMCLLGLPVPAGFTITTEVCTEYYENNHQLPAELMPEVWEAMTKTEEAMGLRYGDSENALLVSCRSGARSSMPGMMDTILNLGLNDLPVAALARNSGEPRFAYDSYRRFIQMFSDVVLGVLPSLFENEIVGAKRSLGVIQDFEIDAATWKKLI